MSSPERVSGQGATKRYLVKCKRCSFEHTADGRTEATRIEARHQQAAGHDVVALEAPPSVQS